MLTATKFYVIVAPSFALHHLRGQYEGDDERQQEGGCACRILGDDVARERSVPSLRRVELWKQV